MEKGGIGIVLKGVIPLKCLDGERVVKVEAEVIPQNENVTIVDLIEELKERIKERAWGAISSAGEVRTFYGTESYFREGGHIALGGFLLDKESVKFNRL